MVNVVAVNLKQFLPLHGIKTSRVNAQGTASDKAEYPALQLSHSGSGPYVRHHLGIKQIRVLIRKILLYPKMFVAYLV